MVSDDMIPHLIAPCSQATDEVLAAEEIDEKRRQRADQHGGTHHVVGAHGRAAHRQRDQRRGDRLVGAGVQHDAEQVLVPDAGELPDHGDDHDRRGQRHDDLPEDAPEAGAVDARRFDQVVGDADIVVAEEQRREREALDAVDQDQAVDRVGEADLAEQEGPGQQRDLARHEDAEQHAAEDDLRAREPPLAEDIAVDGAERGRDDGRRNDHRHRVPEVACDALALAADAEVAPGLRPGVEMEAHAAAR